MPAKFEVRSFNRVGIISTYFPKKLGVTLPWPSDVNKDIGLKTKAKAKDLDPKAKAKAQGLESQGQGQGLEISRSNFSPVFLHHFLLLKCCGCFYVRVLFFVLTAFCQFMNKWICYCC